MYLFYYNYYSMSDFSIWNLYGCQAEKVNKEREKIAYLLSLHNVYGLLKLLFIVVDDSSRWSVSLFCF